MTKLERAKRFLNQTARPGLRVFSLALLAASAYAATISGGELFGVSGTFEGGDTLGGTIVIDTTGSGGILSADLTVDPVGVTIGFNSFTLDSGTSYFYQADFNGPGGSLTLDIDTGTNTFDGYTGGNLCSDDTYCGGAKTTFTPEGPDPPLMSGTLTDMGPATPEPSTVLLTITGGGAVLALRRRKRRA